jgi:hypothetical protein
VNDDDRKLLKRLGYGRAPEIEPTTAEPRPAMEVLDRLLALRAVVSVAHGLDAAAGRRLVDGYDVAHALAPDELEYLEDAADGVRVEDAARATAVEAMAVLAWALGLVDELPLDEPVELADVPADAPEAPRVRDARELRRMHDLHVAMEHALRADPDLAVGAAPGSVDPYVVHQRYGALRFVLGLDETEPAGHG